MNFSDKGSKKTAQKKTNLNTNNYAVIISSQEKKIYFNFIKTTKEADLKKDYNNFSPAEKSVFNFIQNSKTSEKEMDNENLFSNLKLSSFKIFYKTNQVKELKFKNEKISASLNIIKKEPVFPEQINDFIFRIDDNINEFIFAGESIFLIKDDILSEIKTDNKEILNIIKRSFLKKYSKFHNSYSEYRQTSLSQEEILEINTLKKGLKKLFNLKSNLKSNFKITQINTKKEILEINYKHKNNFIEIKPFVDYGIKKIPISESVFIVKQNKENTFQRKFNKNYEKNYIIKIQDDEIIWNKVDPTLEIEFFKYLFNIKDSLGLNQKLVLKKNGANQIKNFLTDNWKNIKALPFEKIYLNEKIDSESIKLGTSLDLKIKNNLLNLEVEFFIGKSKISINELQQYLKHKDGYLKKDDGTLIKIENESEIERLISIINKFKETKKTNTFEGKLYHIAELENIFSNSKEYKIKYDNGYKKFLNEIELFLKEKNNNIMDVKIPAYLKKHLRKYQTYAVGWLSFLKKYNFGGILAEDKGLGKTIQTLTLLSMNKEKGTPSIVIAPKTLLDNWLNESKKFTPDLKTIIVQGNTQERENIIKKLKKYDLVLTSYSLFQRDFEIYEREKIKFNYAVLDEAQYIKNFRTKNAIIVKKINSNYRLTLTGTPLENSIGEIWSIFEFLMPGFLGTYNEFTKKYIKPILRGDKKTLEELKNKISFFMLRRLKSKVLAELPDKTEQKLYIELSSDQKVLYQELLNDIKTNFLANLQEDDYKKSYIQILSSLTKLRQVCNHPNLILKEKAYSNYESEKLNLFNNLIDELLAEDRKVLVFSQFTSMLNILESELKDKNILYSRLDGSTKKRQNVIDNFNKDKKNKVFLISLKAGGVGLNLTSADSVIIFDPWWNPSTENQAIDRAHRIGQKKSVNVYKLIAKNTIEDKILNLQQEKSFLFNSLIDKNEIDFKKLNWNDIKQLFEN